MIPTEVNYAEWFTCAARFYFLKEGYAFLSFELGQVTEPGFPADKLLASGNRIIGLRFLRPAGTVAGAYAVDDATRTRVTQAGQWLLYALPLSADPFDQQLAHQKLAFAYGADADSDAGGHLIARRTLTFKELVAALEAGEAGREVAAGETSGTLLVAAQEGDATLYLIMNRRERTVIVLGNQWR